MSGAAEALDNTTDVETPERVRFRHHVAGPVRRGIAWAVDAVVRGGIIAGVWVVLTAATGSPRAKVSGSGVMLVVLFALEWAYFVALEAALNGQTPGKRALGLRVVKTGGHPVTFVDCVLRNLLRGADFLPVGYVLGLVAMATDRRFRRLGDRVAGTMVVIEERPHALPALTFDAPPTDAELAALPGRPALRPGELDAIETFLRRRSLSLPRRRELAEMIAPPLAARLGVLYDDPERLLMALFVRARGRGGHA